MNEEKESASLDNELLWLLVELTSRLNTANDLESLQDLLNRNLRWILDFDRCTLAIRLEPNDDRFQLLEIVSSKPAGQLTTQAFPLADNWPSRVLMEGKPYFLDDLTQPPPTVRLPADLKCGVDSTAKSLMLLPLQFGEQLIGSLNFSSNRTQAYTVRSRNLATMLALHLGSKLGSMLAYQRTATTLSNLLTYQAHYDLLTGLPNRKLFEDRVQQILEQAHLRNQEIAVLVVGLEGFSRINDSLGHETGDIILQQVTQRLQACVYQSDIVAFIGNNKFTLLLTKLHNQQGALYVAQKLLTALQEGFIVAEHELFVISSIGISLFPTHGENAKELLRKADNAMHHAKEGKSRCSLFSSDMETSRDQLAIESDLRRALERGELWLRYQPQVEIATGKLVGVEALVRWSHSELGVVPPAQFIPLAEASGMIIPIGTWILQEACRQNRAWQQAGYEPFKVSVNVSALQLKQTNFVEVVKLALQNTGLDPNYLELELTESLLMHDYQEAFLKLNQLIELGTEVAIDDFGTGYSSLSYLQQLPANTLKIDQSFVRAVGANSQPASQSHEGAIIQAIIAMAHSLQMKVVAEGVETDQQLEFLRVSECNIAQGYLFSAPLDPSEIEALLQFPPAERVGA